MSAFFSVFSLFAATSNRPNPLLVCILCFGLASSCYASESVVCRLVDVDIEFDGLDFVRHRDVLGHGVISAKCVNSTIKLQRVALQVYDEVLSPQGLATERRNQEKLTIDLFVDAARQVPIQHKPGGLGVLRQTVTIASNGVVQVDFPFFVRLRSFKIMPAGTYEKQSGFRLYYERVDADDH